MKRINNLEDLRYRKLYLRSEIKLKEQKINNQVRDIKIELRSSDIKSEVLQSVLKNPVIVFNIARATYEIITRFNKYKRKRAKRKSKKS